MTQSNQERAKARLRAGGWPITKADIADMLRNYREDRASLMAMLENLQAESNELLYPCASTIDGNKVQKDVDLGKMIDTLLAKCDASRRFYIETLKHLRIVGDRLDKLMFCVSKLPGHLRYVAIEHYQKGRTVEDVASSMDKSPHTVEKYRQESIDRIYERINR